MSCRKYLHAVVCFVGVGVKEGSVSSSVGSPLCV